MPTYGTKETAAAFMSSAEMTEVRARLAQLISECDHHFVPVKEMYEEFKATKVATVVHLGNTQGYSGPEVLMFEVACTKCPTKQKVSVADHCPKCLGPGLTNAPRERATWSTFFDAQQGFDNFQLLRCEACQFTGVYTYYDR